MSEEDWRSWVEIFRGSARKIQEVPWAQLTLEEKHLLNSRFEVGGPKRPQSEIVSPLEAAEE